MSEVGAFKKKLANVFDDDLKTSQWHNIVDYVIIAFIVISTLEVFLSTFSEISEKYGSVLHWVDIVTTIFFTIEVVARIWVADFKSEKYKGFLGRVRYCFTFYGFIDMISTFPFYIHFFYPIPYTMLKVMRITRLFRAFRYMKSFRILVNAMQSKSKELMVSLQFLVVITVILSFILYFTEQAVQPDVYSNGMTPMIWAFMQYLGDPGGFAENYTPVSLGGRIVACLVGVLGIAIFAVPAGLIGSGFTEAIEDEEKKKKLNDDTEKLKLAFARNMDRSTRFQVSPQFVSIYDVHAKLRLSIDDIMEVVDSSNDFRLVNLASTRPVDERPEDRLAVEHFPVNRPYGCCINRKSKVTVVSTSSCAEVGISQFSFYFAKMAGFNYISREIGEIPYNSFYLPTEATRKTSKFQAFMEDLNSLACQEGHWVVTLLSAGGGQEPKYPTHVHFTYGGKKGDTTFDDPNILVHDVPTFSKMLEETENRLKEELGLLCDRQQFHDTSSPNIFLRHLEHAENVNSMAIRIDWGVHLWDSKKLGVAKVMSEVMNKYFDGDKEFGMDPELKVKAIGYDGYERDQL
jgi:voltage-gated potassium channel